MKLFHPSQASPCIGVKHGPCCKTIFHEMLCDIDRFLHRVLTCQSCCDGCSECGVAGPIRFRDHYHYHGSFLEALVASFHYRPLNCTSCGVVDEYYGGCADCDQTVPTPADRNSEELSPDRPVPEPGNEDATASRSGLRTVSRQPQLSAPRLSTRSRTVQRSNYEQRRDPQESSTSEVAQRDTVKEIPRLNAKTKTIRFGNKFGKRKKSSFTSAFK